MCGVQGGSTQQRCCFCTLAAANFRATIFGGAARLWERTACDAAECAGHVLSDPSKKAFWRKKFDNVADVPFVMLGPCSWPLQNIVCSPPVMHNLGYILTDVYEWLLLKVVL